MFSFRPKYSAKKKTVHVLINFLSASAKLAIWLTRKNRAENAGSVEPVPALEGLVKARLRVEHAYYRMMDNLQAFSHLWSCALGGEWGFGLKFLIKDKFSIVVDNFHQSSLLDLL